MPGFQEEEEKKDNSVFIGDKGTMEYVFAVSVQAKQYDEVFIRARGSKISRAVDVSQISISRSLENWEVRSVKIGTHDRPQDQTFRERINNEDGRKPSQRVSFIEILLAKKGQ